jgi:hypothetical protein
VTEHEAEGLYVFIGDGRRSGVVAVMTDKAVEVRGAMEMAGGLVVHLDKKNHGNDYALDFLLAVTPLMDFLLSREICFFRYAPEFPFRLTLTVHLSAGGIPTERARFAVVCPIDRRVHCIDSGSRFHDEKVEKFPNILCKNTIRKCRSLKQECDISMSKGIKNQDTKQLLEKFIEANSQKKERWSPNRIHPSIYDSFK